MSNLSSVNRPVHHSGAEPLTIRRAAALTGVPEHTLRAWERRYDLLRPSRTESGYRVYDDADLARITAMHRLVAAGWAPRTAAQEVALGRFGRDVDPYQNLIEAAAELDAGRVAREVGDRFSRGPFDAVADHWLMPALERLGRAWATGTVSVAGEHLVANTVSRRLSVIMDATPQRHGGHPVLIGTPPGVEHQLGLFAFAVAVARAGLPVVYLGAEVPLDAWTDAAVRLKPRLAVTNAPRRRDAAAASAVVDRLAEGDAVPVRIGGRYQHLVGAPAGRLGHSIGAAATLLAAEAAGAR